VPTTVPDAGLPPAPLPPAPAPLPPRAAAPPAGHPLLPVAGVVAAIACVQCGAAVSVSLFGTLGTAGTTWLRLLVAAAVLLAVARPRGMRREDVAAAALLGVVTAVNTLAFSAATDRVPLGTVVAVEFCGPLAVAALGARGRGAVRPVWPALALVGVVVITTPWRIGGEGGARVWSGLALAGVAAVGWGGYIVLTAHVGRRSEGLQGLAVAMASAAAVLTPLGAPQAWPALRAAVTGTGVGSGVGSGVDARTALLRVLLAALLVPLAAYALEMTALRRLDQGVFGVWMALEPAVGTAAGWALLAQRPAPAQLPGVLLVVLAGIGASRRPASGSAGADAPPAPPALPAPATIRRRRRTDRAGTRGSNPEPSVATTG